MAPEGVGATATERDTILQEPAAGWSAPGMMRDLIERYTVDQRVLREFHNIPLAEAALDRMGVFLEVWRNQVDGIDVEALDLDGRIDWALLRNDISYQLRRLPCERERNRRIREALPIADTIVALEESRRSMAQPSPESTAKQLAGLAEAADAERERLQRQTDGDAAAPSEDPAAPLSEAEARRAAGALDQLMATLKSWFEFHGHYKPEHAWWLTPVYRKARKALRRHAKLLRKRGKMDDEEALVGEPIGREALLSDMARELLAYGPEELVTIADRELAWCLQEIEKAAAELGYGPDWRAALEHVKGQHVPLGKQDELVASLAREAIEYVDLHELVTIDDLCRELWYVDMISRENQKKWPYQAYGYNRILVSFPTQDMDHETALTSTRSNNIHFMRAVTHHELIPGHHLQIYMARRHKAYREVFATPFLGEGWCLHWEMLLWDLGFARGPEDRIGMLFWRMHRCARIVISLRFHLGEMTPDEMVDYLVANVGHEREAAAGEVRRYIGSEYPPLYQCAYMIGALQIRALYRDLVENGPLSPREFHDSVLRENSIPVELIRACLNGQMLGRDFAPSWRFVEGV